MPCGLNITMHMSAMPIITQPSASTWSEEITVVGIVPRMNSLISVSATHSTHEPISGPKTVAAPPISRIVHV